MKSKRTRETLEAKLRNALGPIYALASMVLIDNDSPKLKKIIKQQAKLAQKNTKKIDDILDKIDKRALELKKRKS